MSRKVVLPASAPCSSTGIAMLPLFTPSSSHAEARSNRAENVSSSIAAWAHCMVTSASFAGASRASSGDCAARSLVLRRPAAAQLSWAMARFQPARSDLDPTRCTDWTLCSQTLGSFDDPAASNAPEPAANGSRSDGRRGLCSAVATFLSFTSLRTHEVGESQLFFAQLWKLGKDFTKTLQSYPPILPSHHTNRLQRCRNRLQRHRETTVTI